MQAEGSAGNGSYFAVEGFGGAVGQTGADVLENPVEVLSDGLGGANEGGESGSCGPVDPLVEEMLGDRDDGDLEGDAEAFFEVVCADKGLILLSKPLEGALFGGGEVTWIFL